MGVADDGFASFRLAVNRQPPMVFNDPFDRLLLLLQAITYGTLLERWAVRFGRPSYDAHPF